MRVDGPGETQGFDNMSNRALVGTGDWQHVAVVLDVPVTAIGIVFGVILQGSGEVFADDFTLETVADTVAATNLLPGFVPSGDSATTVATYARYPFAPRNLDLEGVATVATADWLAHNGVPLVYGTPGSDQTDLAPLRTMVGNARVVGMGEATHGTHEFFALKHRVFEFLVQKMGFTHFAIEATWPEANDINTYVLTGQGDPARLLSHLYFWTWNTQEVLTLIQWMRQWNLSASPSQRVQFLGFDMQFPGAALDTVANFISRVDPSHSVLVNGKYACIAPYRNIGAAFAHLSSEYAALPADSVAACRQAVKDVFDLLNSNGDTYRRASSDALYANAVHSARLVQQFELMASQTTVTASARVRDQSMAENVQWLLQQAPPSTRIALWAHNGHVRTVAGNMGGDLQAALGNDYISLGFVFGTGSFNAVKQSGSTFAGLKELTATLVPDGSLESLFMTTGYPLMLFDARQIANGGSAASYLGGPIPMRNIGAAFDPAQEALYFSSAVLPADYQLLLFVRVSTASLLMPLLP